MRIQSKTVCKAAVVLLIGALAPAAQQEGVREFQKTVPLGAGQRLKVENKFGQTSVRAGTGQEVVVRATIKVASDDRAEAAKLVEQVKIEVDETAGGVRVATVYPKPPQEGVRGNFPRNTSFSVNYDITMPAANALEVASSFGAVQVDGIKGGGRVEASHGAVRMQNSGGALEVGNRFGSVEVLRHQGDVTVRSGNGQVTVEGVSGAANVNCSFGKVRLARVGKTSTVTNRNGGVEVEDSGAANLTTTFGAISAKRVKGALTATGGNSSVTAENVGGTVTVSSSFGEVDLRSVGEAVVTNRNGGVKVDGAAGKVTAKTTFGAISLKGVAGGLDLQTENGAVSAQLNGSGCQPATVHTSFGLVRLTMPESVSYDVKASTTFGAVKTDFPLTVSGEMNSRRMDGRIGKGGCALNVTNRNGSIELVKGR